ncbi:Ionotropic receptor 126 [Cephus cinctus]|nr:Ionotropic receptor 126 [Cephus cinctus]
MDSLVSIPLTDEATRERSSAMLLRLLFLSCIFVEAELGFDQISIEPFPRNANIFSLLPNYSDANCRVCLFVFSFFRFFVFSIFRYKILNEKLQEFANDLAESLKDIARRFLGKNRKAVSLVALSKHPCVLYARNRVLESLSGEFALVIGYRKGRAATPASVQDIGHVILLENWTRLEEFFENSSLKRRQRYAVALVAEPRTLGRRIESELASQERLEEKAASKIGKKGYVNVIFLRPICRGTVDVRSYESWYRSATRSRKPTLRSVARWTAASRLGSAELFPSKCRAMKSLIAAPVTNQYTETDVFRIGQSGNWRLHGVAGNFITLFAERLGFRLVITDGNPAGWGTKFPNGCWTGMFGQLLRQEVDVGFGGIQPTVRVTQSFDYSLYYTWDSMVFTTASPRLGHSWRCVLYPFSAKVWLCVVSSFLSYAVLVSLARFVNSYRPPPDASGTEKLVGPFDLWRILVGQSLRYPRGLEQRAILGLWLFSSYVMAASYTSSLVGCLTSPYYVKPPSTLEELNQSGMQLAASIGSTTIFNSSDDPLIMYLKDRLLILDYDELQRVPLTLSERGLAALALKNAASYRNRKYVGNQAKQLYISKDQIISFPTMFYLPRGHPCLEILNEVLARSHANGLMSKWYENYAASIGNVAKKSRRMPLETKHMAIVFQILGSGLLLAGLVFLLELYAYRK